MKELKIYYAVNMSGMGCIFDAPPARSETFGRWIGNIKLPLSLVVGYFESVGFALPEITWKDEPVVLKLTLTLL